jgi:hypothetical protein
VTKINIKEAWVKEAKNKANQLGTLKHSFMNGAGNLIGYLGEIVVRESIGAEHKNTYHFDLIKNGYKIDVKSKLCSTEPKENFECSIAAYNTRQKCDYYIFVRIIKNLKYAWICGAIKKENFFNMATLYKAGYKDQSNGMIFKVDTYNLPINRLKNIDKSIKNK